MRFSDTVYSVDAPTPAVKYLGSPIAPGKEEGPLKLMLHVVTRVQSDKSNDMSAFKESTSKYTRAAVQSTRPPTLAPLKTLELVLVDDSP